MDYQYTTPRVPIAAMYSGPGPCYNLPSLVGYQLHDPRSVHTKGPAYPFGVRTKAVGEASSPGPCHYPGDKIYNNGKDGTPKYSLASRNQELKGMNTPGPGQYGHESKSAQPAYSFGTRHRDVSGDQTPAPNRYDATPMTGNTIQSTKRRSPAYSVTGKNKMGGFSDDLQKTPGPGAYGVTDSNRYKASPPNYSLSSRTQMSGDFNKTPGPGAHSVENSWGDRKRQPSFSFGIRHSQYEAPLITSTN